MRNRKTELEKQIYSPKIGYQQPWLDAVQGIWPDNELVWVDAMPRCR
jgi:hypothetical protein